MAENDPKRWRLKPIEKTIVDAYDPHLEHHKLAEQIGRPDPAVRYRSGDKVYVDVLARLADPKKPAPPGLEVSSRPALGSIVTGRVAVEDIETVHEHDNVKSLKAATELHMDLFHSVPEIHCDPTSLQEAFQLSGMDGSGVVIGVVDVGYDFKHPSFLQPSGKTRLLSLWDQSDPPAGHPGSPPEGFGYGRELTAAQIDAALLQEDPYSALGYSPEISAHGTHVLDIAAGNGRGLNHLGGKPGDGPEQKAPQGVARGADLIFVHLKTKEKQFFGNSRHLLEAVEYIFTKAGNRPAVVNLSLSTSGGPHDGTTLVEQGFEHLLSQDGRAIVVSAGNAFTKEIHAAETVRSDAPQTLEWEVDPRGKNEMEVWYDGGQALRVTLITPEGMGLAELGPVKLGETYAVEYGDEVWGRISHRERDPNNQDNQIDIRLSSPEGKALAGIWTVRLEADPGQAVPFHAWIEQDDQGAGRFVRTNPASLAPSTSHTLGSICCAENLLTVGAFDTSTHAYLHKPYEATAEGPTRKGGYKPDVSAPGKNILAARAHGGTTVMSGTSMAAPHVTGLVALLFQFAQKTGRGLLPIQETRRVILQAAQRAPGTGWDSRLGGGRIDGVETIRALMNRSEESTPENKTVKPESVGSSVELVLPKNGTQPGPEVAAELWKLIAQISSGARIRIVVELEKDGGNGHVLQTPKGGEGVELQT